MGAPPRLDEVVELYRSLGFEVLLAPVEPSEVTPECRACGLLGLLRAVYTRPLRPPRAPLAPPDRLS